MSETKNITVAVVQCGVPAGVTAREQFERLAPMVREAANRGKRGAELVVLPELILGRYFPQAPATPENLARAHALAQPLAGGWATAAFHALARELGVSLVVSLYERTADERFFNTLVLVTPEQPVAATYRKVHIPDDPKFYERPYFARGDEHVVWPTPAATLGPMICYDQWYPEAARTATLGGAEVLMYPTAIGWDHDEPASEQDRQLDAWVTIQRSHTIANMVCLVAANRVGTEGSLTFWGSSFICAPGGRVLAQASRDREEVIAATLELGEIAELRRIWPLLADRRPDAYGALTREQG